MGNPGVIEVPKSVTHYLNGSLNGSISPTFYEQLLLAQIQKVQKYIVDLTIFLCFWHLCAQKQRACKTLLKSTPRVCFLTKWIVEDADRKMLVKFNQSLAQTMPEDVSSVISLRPSRPFTCLYRNRFETNLEYSRSSSLAVSVLPILTVCELKNP